MAIKETGVLNGEHTLYIEFHDFDGDAPDDVDLSPRKTIGGLYVFSLKGQREILASEGDILTIHFEKI